jgi:hypothetical protein
MAATTGAGCLRRSTNSWPEAPGVRLALVTAGAGLAVGIIGLVVDAALIFPSLSVVSATNPVARSFPDIFVYFWTYFTHLTNLWLVVCYLAWVTEWRGLGWFRRPTMLASAAAFITLVMLFYHFMLAPYLEMTGALLVASVLLHYVAPLLYLFWWVVGAPHGGLGWWKLPVMLLPGVLYVAWVLLRGAIVHEYPYDILNADKAGYFGVAIGVMILLVAVSIFAAILIGADRLLARRNTRH